MESTSEKLLALWRGMLSLAERGERKDFRNAQDDFNRVYKRANYQEQGHYHMLLAQDHKEAPSALESGNSKEFRNT